MSSVLEPGYKAVYGLAHWNWDIKLFKGLHNIIGSGVALGPLGVYQHNFRTKGVDIGVIVETSLSLCIP